MCDHAAENLAGLQAEILLTDKTVIPVTFGHDVQLEWNSGTVVPSMVEPQKHPEIRGHMAGKLDYTHIKDAELILNDGRVFKIAFHNPQHFTAHESINSRTHV